jgi:hypothetical protein
MDGLRPRDNGGAMRNILADERREAIDALTIRYVCGELSEVVYHASLRRFCEANEIRHLTMMNQTAHRNSLPFKRGEVT